MASLSSRNGKKSSIGRPRTAPREEKKAMTGYECEFVEPPPKQLQTECSICLMVLREPHMISCCGNSFCETCIGRIQRGRKPCPLCKEPRFSIMANKHLKRTLNEFQVRCPHRELGCEWVGELRHLDQHLNEDPQPEHQHEGCPFTLFECIDCEGEVQRRMMEDHEDECPKRPYTCEYCEEYESTFEDVVNHWEKCKYYLLPCPNNCHPSGSGIERQNLDHHMKEECPLTVVECDFHYAGCAVKLPRKDMALHMKEESMVHISLLTAENQRLAKQLLERDKKMEQQNTELSNRIDQLQQAYHDLQREHHEQRDQQELANQQTNQKLGNELSHAKHMRQLQQKAHRELEERVADTTGQQQKTNQELEKMLTQIEHTQQQQQRAHQELVEKVAGKQQGIDRKLVNEVIPELRRDLNHTICAQVKTEEELIQTRKKLQISQHELAQRITLTEDQQQKTKQELKKELTKTKERLQEAHQKLGEKVCTVEQMRELKKELAKTKDRVDRLQETHQKLGEKVCTVELQNAKMRKQLTETRERLREAHQRLAERSDQQQKAHQKAMQQQQTEYSQLSSEMAVLMQEQQQMKELSSEVAVLMQGQQQMKEKVAILMQGQQQMKELSSEVAILTQGQKQIKEKVAILMQGQQQMKELSSEVAILTQGQKQMKEKVAILMQGQQQMKELSSEVAILTQGQKQMKEKVAILMQGQQQIKELSSKVVILTQGQQQMEDMAAAIQMQVQQQMGGMRQRPQILPIDVKMAVFKAYKDTNTEWCSTPFYTQAYGYKMRLKVYANGYREGVGTHISVFTYLIRGEFDSDLDWPFRGDITIQLLNQLEDRAHHTKTIRYTDTTPTTACRLTVGESEIWGISRFIPHGKLSSYLRNDCLVFSVKLQ